MVFRPWSRREESPEVIEGRSLAPRERARRAGSAVMSLRLALENENAESVFSIGCVPRRPHFHSRRAIEAAPGRVARRCARRARIPRVAGATKSAPARQVRRLLVGLGFQDRDPFFAL